MTARVRNYVGSGLRLLAWLGLTLVGFLAFLVMGWVPPELAAMLGSRRYAVGSRDPAAASEAAERRTTPPEQD